MGVFGSSRTYGAQLVNKAVCGFFGDSAMADPAFGDSLFNPSKISAISSSIQLGNLTAEEQALLASYYQSAMGAIGGVFIQQNGCDYHGQSVQNNIAPSDFEAGRMVAMFLAACSIAKVKGSIILLSNGQAIANGTQAATVSGQNVKGPSAQGDAGGSYNAGLILCYDPSTPPLLRTTGNFDTSNGNVRAASGLQSNTDAVAGLYMTAAAHLGLDMNAVNAAMLKAGVNATSTLMLI
jgi:hypothetical protein